LCLGQPEARWPRSSDGGEVFRGLATRSEGCRVPAAKDCTRCHFTTTRDDIARTSTAGWDDPGSRRWCPPPLGPRRLWARWLGTEGGLLVLSRGLSLDDDLRTLHWSTEDRASIGSAITDSHSLGSRFDGCTVAAALSLDAELVDVRRLGRVEVGQRQAVDDEGFLTQLLHGLDRLLHRKVFVALESTRSP
jgi:hypothetical protein